MLAYSEVTEVDGYVGNFKVKVTKKARCVDIDKCTGCGLCTEACVVRKVSNEFDQGLSKRSAVYIPFPQAVPLRATIDPVNCLTRKGKKCKQPCVAACGPGAIDFDQKDEEITVEVGAIIMATGFELWDATQESRYSYGHFDDVISSLEFERISNASGPTGGHIVCKNGEAPKSVAILHCVGSRDENYQEFCSRVCCMYSLKFSHLIKEHLPETEVYECYIDMRCFGKGYEEFYRRLMNEGVNFIRGRAAEISEVALAPEEEGRLIVKVEDTLLGIVRRIPVDMVILSAGLAPRKDAKATAQIFGFGCSADGFYLERHPKLEPVSTVTDGIFIAGCCQYPKDIPDTVAQAGAAAAGALALVDNATVKVEPTISYIDPEKCSGCHICVGLCPHAAIQYNEEKGVAEVIEAALQGLRRLRRGLRVGGAAAAWLPRRTDLRRDRRGPGPLGPASVKESAVSEQFEPRLIGFLCRWCSYNGADLAGTSRLKYPPNVVPIKTNCSGRVDPTHVMKAFAEGADGVIIAGCHPGDCHYINGNYRTAGRFPMIQKLLEQLGLEHGRVRLEWVSAAEGDKFARVVREFTEEIRALGPLGWEKELVDEGIESVESNGSDPVAAAEPVEEAVIA